MGASFVTVNGKRKTIRKSPSGIKLTRLYRSCCRRANTTHWLRCLGMLQRSQLVIWYGCLFLPERGVGERAYLWCMSDPRACPADPHTTEQKNVQSLNTDWAPVCTWAFRTGHGGKEGGDNIKKLLENVDTFKEYLVCKTGGKEGVMMLLVCECGFFCM